MTILAAAECTKLECFGGHESCHPQQFQVQKHKAVSDKHDHDMVELATAVLCL